MESEKSFLKRDVLIIFTIFVIFSLYSCDFPSLGNCNTIIIRNNDNQTRYFQVKIPDDSAEISRVFSLEPRHALEIDFYFKPETGQFTEGTDGPDAIIREGYGTTVINIIYDLEYSIEVFDQQGGNLLNSVLVTVEVFGKYSHGRIIWDGNSLTLS